MLYGVGGSIQGEMSCQCVTCLPHFQVRLPHEGRRHSRHLQPFLGQRIVPSDCGQVNECAWAWVGDEEAPALAQLQLAAAGARWATLDAQGQGFREGLPPELARVLRRRRFLVEKARAANIVGARTRAYPVLQ